MKKTNKPATANVEQPAAPQLTTAPLPKDSIAQIRAAASLDDAVKLLQPDLRPKTKALAVYEIVADCTEPLPKLRGACVKVFAACARREGTFTAKDIADELKDVVKSAPYWVRKLATSGHIREVEVKS